MPAGVAVTVKGLADNRASNVRVSVHGVVGAWGVEGGSKISGRSDRDRLRCAGVCWTDSVKLEIRGDATFINDIAGFYADVAVKVNSRTNIRRDVDRSGDVAGNVHVYISLPNGAVGIDVGIDDQMSREG